MLGFHIKTPLEFNTLEFLGYITMIQLWWVAIWGIAYIVIEYFAGKSKLRELFIYFILLGLILMIILSKPDLIKHI